MVPGERGWGFSDIFIHTLARAIFWGFKILNSNNFGGLQKNENFGGGGFGFCGFF